MKVFRLAAVLGCFLIVSCSTDFNVTAPWKDITVVYGLLDQSDTANYIKIGKAFLDPTTDAYTIAQNPDSLYYPDLNVVLQEFQNNQLKKTITLEKVDGDSEGYVKDTGIFAQSPNILYKTKEKLNQDSRYNLVITEPDNNKQITSSTSVINDFSVFIPNTLLKVNFQKGSAFHVSWTSAVDGKIYGLVIRFYYTEYHFDDPSFKAEKYVDWTVFSSVTSNDTLGSENMDQDIQGDGFYSFMTNAIPYDPNAFRILRNSDWTFSVGGYVLYEFNQVTVAQQGLTSGEVLPTYTNIDNGIGLLSSRYHKTIAGVSFSSNMIDSLACLSDTHHLNFLRSDSTLCP